MPLITKANEFDLSLARFRYEAATKRQGTNIICLGFEVKINDGQNFYMLYKDLFVKRIYHFEAEHPRPLIIDCGSNIGMSILYFKHTYPDARIIGFEADPAIYPYVQENVSQNELKDVELIQAALAKQDGKLTFYSDGKYGSCLAEYAASIPDGWIEYEVPCVRLRDYLTEPVDFLKMNIEGAEWDVLADSGERLRLIKEMVIEYHHLPGLPRTLHKILELLHNLGFEYLINDLDLESNGGVRSPFSLKSDSKYFLLIYARRSW